MVRVFTVGPGDLASIPRRVIPKIQKIELAAFLLNTQNYKVRIKGRVEPSRERSNALPYNLGKGSFWVTLRLRSLTLLYFVGCFAEAFVEVFKGRLVVT